MREDEGEAVFFYGIREKDNKNTTRTAVVDEIRWDEFYMAPSATTINENGKHLAVCCAEACGPEVLDLTGA
jgi:hypothetical protein